MVIHIAVILFIYLYNRLVSWTLSDSVPLGKGTPPHPFEFEFDENEKKKKAPPFRALSESEGHTSFNRM